MSRSKAKKVRQRKIRAGFLNPEISRLDWNGLNPVTRRTPTRREKWIKTVNKHKGRHLHDDLYFIYSRRQSVTEKFFCTILVTIVAQQLLPKGE